MSLDTFKESISFKVASGRLQEAARTPGAASGQAHGSDQTPAEGAASAQIPADVVSGQIPAVVTASGQGRKSAIQV